MPEPVLEIQGLRKTYKGHLSLTSREVIKGLDLRIEPGEVFGLLGQNGAGKTTTIKMILALIFPDAGTIRIFGADHLGVTLRARIGFLPENPYFYEYLTGREFLRFYGQLFGYGRAERNRRAADVLARVGMSTRADLPLRKYSKGMLQRIGMAQALINDPDFVILDEPMSGLDPIGRREFRDLILDLKAHGKTVFFSSHILSDAEAICDRVGILKDGRVALAGRLSDLLSPAVASWEVTISGPAFASLPLNGFSGSLISVRGTESLVRVDAEADLQRLLDVVRSSGGRLISVTARRDTLEDLYVREVAAR
ncbi:MAG TPA: ABC transporter ATP-binding protein [Patescibacteria group bacterium]|nr:ABC transporter ATP-binding protein [Patescibacteria group bacterium]